MDIKKLAVGFLQANCYILVRKQQGIIIDPGGEPGRIIKAVSGLKIDLILLTHNHFDHIEALLPVKESVRSEVAIHAYDMIDIADRELTDGEKIPFGGNEISVIHTPGHTPGSCCFLLEGKLFSGDTLFAGGWGNTMFPGGDERAIFKSIREKIMRLPDETIVYPGHGDSTTIGEEKYLYL
jgi:glyoxylase-like metal-dependent hydrolase (beta-lactamase superfamily II)